MEFDDLDSKVVYVLLFCDKNIFIVIGCLILSGELGWIVVLFGYCILVVYKLLFVVFFKYVEL